MKAGATDRKKKRGVSPFTTHNLVLLSLKDIIYSPAPLTLKPSLYPQTNVLTLLLKHIFGYSNTHTDGGQGDKV